MVRCPVCNVVPARLEALSACCCCTAPMGETRKRRTLVLLTKQCTSFPWLSLGGTPLHHSRYLRPFALFALSLSCFRRGRPARTSLSAGAAYVSVDGAQPGHRLPAPNRERCNPSQQPSDRDDQVEPGHDGVDRCVRYVNSKGGRYDFTGEVACARPGRGVRPSLLPSREDSVARGQTPAPTARATLRAIASRRRQACR